MRRPAIGNNALNLGDCLIWTELSSEINFLGALARACLCERFKLIIKFVLFGIRVEIAVDKWPIGFWMIKH